MTNIKNISDETFDQEVQGSTPVLVDFWAEWCGPCRLTGPVLEQVAAELGEQIRILKLNVDDYPQAAQRFGIRGIPTMILFKDGSPIDEIVGYHPKPLLLRKLAAHLVPAAGVV